jgi:tetratricopeptide (TPR) repeat protein
MKKEASERASAKDLLGYFQNESAKILSSLSNSVGNENDDDDDDDQVNFTTIFLPMESSDVFETSDLKSGEQHLDELKYVEALRSFEKSLLKRKEFFGETKDHPEMAYLLDKIGLCYLKLIDYNKALE